MKTLNFSPSHLVFVGILLAMATCFVQPALAQSPRLGHINSGELVSLMPETKKAEDSLKRFAEGMETQVQAMLSELKVKYADFQSKSKEWSESLREYKTKEIQDLQSNIDNFQQRAQQDIAKRKEDLLGPVIQKAEEAIKAIAKEGNYDYIFDTSSGNFLYTKDSDNLLETAKKKLKLP
ncbi:MAG: OmpH family outer membrane protein [Cytophagia bacterium]|nr:OmpH family outer membrane protein [Cytophagia bacterium]